MDAHANYGQSTMAKLRHKHQGACPSPRGQERHPDVPRHHRNTQLYAILNLKMTLTSEACNWTFQTRHQQGWGQIRFIKYKYKYKYKNLDFSNTNTCTNTNIFFNFDSNTNTNTNTSIQIQIQIRSTKYICRNCSGSKIGQFYKSQDICSWPVFPYV